MRLAKCSFLTLAPHTVHVDQKPFEAQEYLGVDLGIKNIAVDGDGGTYSGGHLNGLRNRHAKLRSRLQSKTTRSARKLPRKRSMNEHRFASDVNHVVSKRIVAKAKDTGRGIALEGLGGIRERITVRRSQRRVHHSWGFYQLRSFVEYKARLRGFPSCLLTRETPVARAQGYKRGYDGSVLKVSGTQR